MIIIYLIAFIIGVILPVFLITSVFLGFYSDIKGSPFVPTSSKLLDKIFNKIKIKKGGKFLELGSGDGRVVRFVAQKYQMDALGVDINPYLVWYSKVYSKISGLKNAKFKSGDFFNINFNEFDLIFIFLLPRTLKRLEEKFYRECKQGTLIISHGFGVRGLEKKTVGKLEGVPFPTYYYKI